MIFFFHNRVEKFHHVLLIKMANSEKRSKQIPMKIFNRQSVDEFSSVKSTINVLDKTIDLESNFNEDDDFMTKKVNYKQSTPLNSKRKKTPRRSDTKRRKRISNGNSPSEINYSLHTIDETKSDAIADTDDVNLAKTVDCSNQTSVELNDDTHSHDKSDNELNRCITNETTLFEEESVLDNQTRNVEETLSETALLDKRLSSDTLNIQIQENTFSKMIDESNFSRDEGLRNMNLTEIESSCDRYPDNTFYGLPLNVKDILVQTRGISKLYRECLDFSKT